MDWSLPLSLLPTLCPLAGTSEKHSVMRYVMSDMDTDKFSARMFREFQHL